MHPREPEPPPARVLDRDDVTRLLPSKVTDRAGWAEDVIAAIRLTKKEPTPERVCAVLAVIEQESGFAADPAVADLPRIVREGLKEKLARFGPLADPALSALLETTSPDGKSTFGERIARLRTERDLDRFFRDVALALRNQLPAPLAALGKDAIADLNPVTTAGSMQVKVSFARELGKKEGLDDDDVRELLYTRGGGVRFGTARLIGYPASYDDVVYRFADYNAGMYTSRNAAFQQLLIDLTGQQLVLDGDLLAYDKSGAPKDESRTLHALLDFAASRDLSEGTVRRDAKKEKSEDFGQAAAVCAHSRRRAGLAEALPTAHHGLVRHQRQAPLRRLSRTAVDGRLSLPAVSRDARRR
jgi:hypothetical protein